MLRRRFVAPGRSVKALPSTLQLHRYDGAGFAWANTSNIAVCHWNKARFVSRRPSAVGKNVTLGGHSIWGAVGVVLTVIEATELVMFSSPFVNTTKYWPECSACTLRIIKSLAAMVGFHASPQPAKFTSGGTLSVALPFAEIGVPLKYH